MKIHPANLHYTGFLFRTSYVNQFLIDDIKARGQLNPITVKSKGNGKYEFEAGMCRVVSCLILGIDVECIEI
jgi:ParB-like chromosome segregation protein Spo0J